MSLDDLRLRYPTWGFALYALEPGGPVTLEAHTPDRVFAFKGKTAAAAIARAFPPEEPPAPPPAHDVFD